LGDGNKSDSQDTNVSYKRPHLNTTSSVSQLGKVITGKAKRARQIKAIFSIRTLPKDEMVLWLTLSDRFVVDYFCTEETLSVTHMERRIAVLWRSFFPDRAAAAVEAAASTAQRDSEDDDSDWDRTDHRQRKPIPDPVPPCEQTRAVCRSLVADSNVL
jgi:hypothetical protein